MKPEDIYVTSVQIEMLVVDQPDPNYIVKHMKAHRTCVKNGRIYSVNLKEFIEDHKYNAHFVFDLEYLDCRIKLVRKRMEVNRPGYLPGVLCDLLVARRMLAAVLGVQEKRKGELPE